MSEKTIKKYTACFGLGLTAIGLFLIAGYSLKPPKTTKATEALQLSTVQTDSGVCKAVLPRGAVVVSIHTIDSIHIVDQEYKSLGQLTAALQWFLQNGRPNVVGIRADPKVEFEVVGKVADVIRDLGAKEGLMTSRDELGCPRF